MGDYARCDFRPLDAVDLNGIAILGELAFRYGRALEVQDIQAL
jgi:hypothetical protein